MSPVESVVGIVLLFVIGGIVLWLATVGWGHVLNGSSRLSREDGGTRYAQYMRAIVVLVAIIVLVAAVVLAAVVLPRTVG